MIRLGALFIILTLSPIPSWACYVSPSEQSVPADELIGRTSNIVLAKAVSAELVDQENPDTNQRPFGDVYQKVEYKFKVLMILKGHSENTFSMTSFPQIFQAETTDFNNHEDKEFWNNDGGRLHHDPSCSIFPKFSVGATYLMFLDKPYHKKSFEQIIRYGWQLGSNDKWLEYVKSKVQ